VWTENKVPVITFGILKGAQDNAAKRDAVINEISK